VNSTVLACFYLEVRPVFWLAHRANHGWISGKTDGFVSSVKLHTGFGGPPSLLSVGYREPFAGVKVAAA